MTKIKTSFGVNALLVALMIGAAVILVPILDFVYQFWMRVLRFGW